MTEQLHARLAENQRVIEASTPGPWESEGGGEIGQHWSRPEPWKPIVSTQVSCGSYCYGGSAEGVREEADAEFITAARTEWPRVNEAVRAVLEVHRKVPLYAHEDACETPDDQDHRDDRHILDSGEYWCEDLVEEYTCAECYRVQDLDSLGGPPAYPCSTVKAIQEAMQ